MRFFENFLWGTVTVADLVEGAVLERLQRRVTTSSARWCSGGMRRNGLK